MTTPKTWEEVVELVAAAIYTPPAGSNRPTPWTADRLAEQQAIAGARCAATVRAKAALAALRAAGLAVVPRGETTAIGYVMSGINGQPTWSAALSAGELAPPDKGEG